VVAQVGVGPDPAGELALAQAAGSVDEVPHAPQLRHVGAGDRPLDVVELDHHRPDAGGAPALG
jgi:hypothetical protein